MVWPLEGAVPQQTIKRIETTTAPSLVFVFPVLFFIISAALTASVCTDSTSLDSIHLNDAVGVSGVWTVDAVDN